MTKKSQRGVKWCPEMGILLYRTWDGRTHLYSLAEVADMAMSEGSHKIMDQVIAFAKSNPNQWIDY